MGHPTMSLHSPHDSDFKMLCPCPTGAPRGSIFLKRARGSQSCLHLTADSSHPMMGYLGSRSLTCI